MSPRSRGRPKNRGRQSTRRRPPTAPVSPERRALREAGVLLEPGADRFAAELFASSWLGRAWATAELGDRRPERAAAARVTELVRTQPSLAGAAAMAAFALVLDAEDAADVVHVLSELGLPPPRWADEPAPKPVRAEVAEDPWGARQTWFVHYDEPAPHLLMATAFHPGGTEVDTLTIAYPEALKAYDEAIVDDLVPAPRRELTLGAALGGLRDAMRATDLLWPRTGSDAYIESRLLAWRRIEAFAEPEQRDEERLSDAERERLTAGFLSRRTDGDSDSAQFLTDVFLDYGVGHLKPDPLAWSPSDVLVFLLDHVPHQIVLDGSERALLPTLLADWVRFALHERGTDEQWVTPVVAAVEDHAAELDEVLTDEVGGPAAQLAGRLATADTAILPEGSAVRITVTLLGTRPRVWRRVVVSSEITLGQLHEVLQWAMGWEDSHLHEWEVAGARYGPAGPGSDAADERAVRLVDVAAEGARLGYLYDFGDGWEHEVRVEEVLLPAEAGDVPRCEAGGGGCPPEDIGGIPGFDELRSAITDPAAASEWARELAGMYEGYDPDRFSPDQANRALRWMRGDGG